MNALSVDDRRHLLALARTTVEAAVLGQVAAPLSESLPPVLRRPAGAFVTLHVDGDLRGCIGHVEPRHPLAETVARAARSATFDSRFARLTAGDLAGLEVEISVLGPLVPLSPEDVEVGVHGLLLECQQRAGLLLPQVPVHYGWDRETFLDHLCRKAGLPPGSWKREDARLLGFTAEVFAEGD
jgi:AmmeMemoRadiSam system protein A